MSGKLICFSVQELADSVRAGAALSGAHLCRSGCTKTALSPRRSPAAVIPSQRKDENDKAERNIPVVFTVSAYKSASGVRVLSAATAVEICKGTVGCVT